MLCNAYLVLVLCVFNNYPITGYLTRIKPYNHVLLSEPKHVSTLPSYVAIINGIFPNWQKKKTDTVYIKDELVLNGMTRK